MRFDTLDSIRADQLDFVPRQRRDRVLRTIFAFVLTITMVFILAYAPIASRYAIYAPFAAILLMALLCLYVAYQEQVTLDLVMAAEYQNMLYSQALSLGANFTLIARREGAIVYASEGMDQVFPDFDYAQSRVLDGVFEKGMVRKTDRERILAAIRTGTSERLVFTIGGQYQAGKEFILTVEPMPRPSGYSMVRGREYLGKRKGSADALRESTVDKIEHLLNRTDIAHYTTDPFGKFEYVNAAFEQLFGYAPGEITESKLSLHHLVFRFGERALTEEYSLADFSGPAVILSKTGRLNANVRQWVMRDSAGKTLGATGTFSKAA